MIVSAEMRRRRLGAAGPELSVVGLGGWEAGGGRTWGGNADEAEVVRALRTGWELGADWIDTAEVYAQGGSEQLIGRALAGYDEVRVMSKVGARPDGTGLRAAEVASAVEGSLRRLRRDCIDAYLMHWRDPGVPLEETWSALAALADRGLVRQIGLSNVSLEDYELCAAMRPVDVVQLQASLLFRAELEALGPACARRGTGVVCYGPLAYGLLAGYSGGGADWRGGGEESDDFFVLENHERFFAPDALPGHLRRVAALRDAAAQLGLTPAQAAIGWLISQPGVTAAIVGSRSPRHVAENVAAGGLHLDLDSQRLIAAAVGG